MNWNREWKVAFILVAGFLLCFHLPVEWLKGFLPLGDSFFEALHLVKWYAREHVLLCLVPAFFIAGAISTFLSKASVMKYLGPGANKLVAYGVASISGTILAVCSCTVLPLFAGIYRMGAGLGPATAFLYSGPAINVLAIILTARILGTELGVARAVGAVLFSVVIGLAMHFIFRGEEEDKGRASMIMPEEEARSLGRTAIFFGLMVAVLVFVNWGKPVEESGLWHAIYSAKWTITGALGLVLTAVLVLWMEVKAWKAGLLILATGISTLVFPSMHMIPFAVYVLGLSWITSIDKGSNGEWFGASWGFARQILPLLLAGVVVAGFLLGRPGKEGIIPSEWITGALGGNSLGANLFASVAGAFMYFATLTEIPILQGLIGAGMGKGPALALLLAGPALSLPNMLVIRSVMGTKKTIVFVALVIVMATISGIVYGSLF